MSTGSVCWVPDDASRTSRQGAARVHIAGYAPAQRQGSALHPCGIPCTPCRGSCGYKAVIGRAEASCKFYWQRSRARSGGAANIFGCDVVGRRAATRVTPRNFLGPTGEVVQAAYMPALQAWLRKDPIVTLPPVGRTTLVVSPWAYLSNDQIGVDRRIWLMGSMYVRTQLWQPMYGRKSPNCIGNRFAQTAMSDDPVLLCGLCPHILCNRPA